MELMFYFYLALISFALYLICMNLSDIKLSLKQIADALDEDEEEDEE